MSLRFHPSSCAASCIQPAYNHQTRADWIDTRSHQECHHTRWDCPPPLHTHTFHYPHTSHLEGLTHYRLRLAFCVHLGVVKAAGAGAVMGARKRCGGAGSSKKPGGSGSTGLAYLHSQVDTLVACRRQQLLGEFQRHLSAKSHPCSKGKRRYLAWVGRGHG
jgi:hypothetical protein